METPLETIDLDIEEANELLFKVKVEGIEQAPAKVRLVCEGGDMDYVFRGTPTRDEGVVQFVLPPMKGKLKEGRYLSRVEVLIVNRYFCPVSFNINLKRAVGVVAEAIRVPAKKEITHVSVVASSPTVVNRKTLKERHAANHVEPKIVGGEELIKELARSFIRGK